NPHDKDIAILDERIQLEYGGPKATTTLVTAEGESISYTVCNKREGRLIAGIGGLFMGMISTGLGEMNGYFLLQRCKVPSKVSVATSVFVISITALLSSAGHFVRFATGGGDDLATVLSIVMFTAPGVIIGGQIGARIASRIPQRNLELSLAVLFILVAGLTLYQSIEWNTFAAFRA
ncbi:MAG: sulfite exporter TauE/SafE family protein, partial [Spirochaetota bacterium]